MVEKEVEDMNMPVVHDVSLLVGMNLIELVSHIFQVFNCLEPIAVLHSKTNALLGLGLYVIIFGPLLIGIIFRLRIRYFAYYEFILLSLMLFPVTSPVTQGVSDEVSAKFQSYINYFGYESNLREVVPSILVASQVLMFLSAYIFFEIHSKFYLEPRRNLIRSYKFHSLRLSTLIKRSKGTVTFAKLRVSFLKNIYNIVIKIFISKEENLEGNTEVKGDMERNSEVKEVPEKTSIDEKVQYFESNQKSQELGKSLPTETNIEGKIN